MKAEGGRWKADDHESTAFVWKYFAFSEVVEINVFSLIILIALVVSGYYVKLCVGRYFGIAVAFLDSSFWYWRS
jgi:hypothetical protein